MRDDKCSVEGCDKWKFAGLKDMTMQGNHAPFLRSGTGKCLDHTVEDRRNVQKNPVKRLILLDIDGVLNGSRWIDRNGFPAHYVADGTAELTKDNVCWDPYPVSTLKHILKITNAKLFIHSSWSMFFTYDDFVKMLGFYDFPADVLIGSGMYQHRHMTRADAIHGLLEHLPLLWDIDECVILDDDLEDWHEFQLEGKVIPSYSPDEEVGLLWSDRYKIANCLCTQEERYAEGLERDDRNLLRSMF